ncbi:FSR family fosmidomycin resistance protein-like MFS transporter [Aminobacter ciceronei]|uniref:Fosmidomycin resistance protein n=3 Tax=Phyllobacteriaceae TaxID=69277 RepID=A0AAC9AQW6_AMIAI|nr:Fosmidomycin resistance protein [Aminobacter aminovorans]MBA8909028.1 FSR family fosmidomycin resistance protein-like MFS transporter [Aminobacter ciceronei]MBA9022722.1 FSR family fosmidomycin resistance protein-like MFS transporter [Aminobacter ciceronei]MBB3709306.1 FSR family fosmidomycin resistance protein-like MFS transporter [Aminobacter aminovorans]
MTDTAISARSSSADGTVMAILLAVSFSHFLNDVMQSLISSLYPMLKDDYHLDFWQIGLLTTTFQVTASLLQPVIGMYTDKKPLPFSLPIGMCLTLIGLLTLAFAHSYSMLLVGSAFVGLGSAIFHPESSRVARLASGGRFGLAQSLFQVGGNFGSALGPLLAALIVVPLGQGGIAWFSIAAMVGIVVLIRVSVWYSRHIVSAAKRAAPTLFNPLPRNKVISALVVLAILVCSKQAYTASLSSYYTFYVIERFGVSVQESQYLLFLFLGAAALGTFLGGPIGDRFGAKTVIWFSILGVLPFTLMLPYADLFWTKVLTVLIGLILASAFSAIVVFAQELVPGRVGLIAGIFFGFAFGIGGIAAAVLGVIADSHGIEYVFKLCSFLPMLGLLTVFLPNMKAARLGAA